MLHKDLGNKLLFICWILSDLDMKYTYWTPVAFLYIFIRQIVNQLEPENTNKVQLLLMVLVVNILVGKLFIQKINNNFFFSS